MRRFALRCEIDAAFFHLYLPANPDKRWCFANSETNEDLTALTAHFPTPVMLSLISSTSSRLFGDGKSATLTVIGPKIEYWSSMICMQDAQRSGLPYASRLGSGSWTQREVVGVSA